MTTYDPRTKKLYDESGTSWLRMKAQEAESNLDWITAAELWRLAAERYPAQPGSELAKHDINNMLSRAKEAEVAARMLSKDT